MLLIRCHTDTPTHIDIQKVKIQTLLSSYLFDAQIELLFLFFFS